MQMHKGFTRCRRVADQSCAVLLQTIAKANGLIKGRVSNPACDLPLREDGKLAVGAAVGAGRWSAHACPVVCGLEPVAQPPCHHL